MPKNVVVGTARNPQTNTRTANNSSVSNDINVSDNVSAYVNLLTDAETVRNKNGKPLFHEWSKLPEEFEDCSRQQINRAYRVKGD